MPLRNRGRIWHYRFKLDGKEYSGATDLVATKQNTTKAQDVEADHRRTLLEGRRPQRIVVREFTDAAGGILTWARKEQPGHPNSSRRVAGSVASAKQFSGHATVR